MLFSSLGNMMEDDITASSAEVFSSEGRSVTLSCTYSVKADNLQWYRQDPGSFLIFHLGTQNETKSGLSVRVSEDKTKIILQISSAAVTDSAVYYCASWSSLYKISLCFSLIGELCSFFSLIYIN
uniref:Ig-like domain-containing protein n=1 Tax=Sander lucioperca TaxID=283035 RepID=A0A8C9ZKP4_SANLU